MPPITSVPRNNLSSPTRGAAVPGSTQLALLETGVTLADMSAGRTRPADAIAKAKSASYGSSRLTYPEDLPQYFFLIHINEYNRSSWLSLGALALEETISLPLPLQIADTSTVDYERTDLGYGMGSLYDAAASSTEGNWQDAAAGVATAGGIRLGGALVDWLAGDGAAAATGSFINGMAGAAGYAVNQFQTIALKGPNYKEHTLSWKLSPNSRKESATLSRIKAALDRAKAPHMPSSAGSLFWEWPRVVQLGYFHVAQGNIGNKLYYFNPSVITSTTFDFTESGQPAFYADTKAPESMVMTIKFMELEYWLRDDPRFQQHWD